jgi:hypothetical protein
LAAGIEGLDHEHVAATAGARLSEWLRRRRIDFDRRFGRRRCQSEEFAHSRDGLGAVLLMLRRRDIKGGALG